MFKAECPIAARPGFFSQFRVDSPQEATQALIDSWSTPEQQEFNRTHKQCSTCRGIGYAVYRSRGMVIRERAGCYTCLGIGVVKCR